MELKHPAVNAIFVIRPYRLMVRTPASQAVNPGSTPGRVTTSRLEDSALRGARTKKLHKKFITVVYI